MASKASAALRHSRLGARRRLVNPTQASKERIGDKEAFEVPGSAGRRIFSGIPLRQGALGMLGQLHSNTVFMCGLLAWTIAQILKLFTTYFATGTWRWKVRAHSVHRWQGREGKQEEEEEEEEGSLGRGDRCCSIRGACHQATRPWSWR